MGGTLGENAFVGSPGCETVLRAIAAYNRRELGALVAEMHPEIELQPPLTALAGNVYRGHDGVAQWLTDLDETFERTHIEPVEVEDVGGLVLALTTFSVEGRLPLESELGLLCDMRDGLIVGWAGHFDHATARAEARERAGTPGVRLVREAIDAYNRRDTEALAALMSPDVDLRPPVTELWGIAYSGHGGIRRWMADVEDSFVYAQIVPNELEDLGGLVLALTTFEVKGGESQLEFDSELGLVWETSDGRIVSWRGHFSHAAARAEAEARASTPPGRPGPPPQ